ncbi:MAG: hypothetical protein DRJ10_08530 [Bacteroidetes bacterium]|nr:MAG: hypothetical protein DRJ10_08530 [Bacteroidota bacterium]
MQHIESNPSQGLGIAGIIVGIFSIFFAVIPCTIFLGIILGVIGLILTIIGLNQAKKINAQKGLLIAGLITSILGILISGLWGLAFTEMVQQNDLFEKIEYIDENFETIDNSFENNDKLDSIQFETDKTMQELEQQMDEIEQEKPANPHMVDDNN